VNESVDS